MFGQSSKIKIVFGGLCSLGVGLATANVLRNSIYVNEWKEVVQMYRYGAEVPVSKTVLKKVQTVMDDMQLTHEEKELIKPFTVFGFDMYHAGSTSTSYGAIVGIPSNFYYSNIDEIDTENINVQNRPVDWLSNVAQKFKESLLLSEEAQKFLIAREIASVQSPFIFLKTLYPLSYIFMIFVLSNKLNKKLNLSQKPPIIQGILYTLVSLFGVGVWVFSHDFTTIQTEIEVDKAACALGEQYVRGGLEAYSKILERNICLRELMGSKGASVYTPTGNDIYFIRQKHLPPSYRKSFMEMKLTESKSESSTNREVQAKTKDATPKNVANSVS